MTDFVRVYVSLREDWPVLDISTEDRDVNAEIPRKLIEALEKARNDVDRAENAIVKFLGLHDVEDAFRLEPLNG